MENEQKNAKGLKVVVLEKKVTVLKFYECGIL